MLERKRKGGSWDQAGSCYKKYGYLTRADAKEAEIQFRADLKNNPPLPSTALVNVVASYLIDSADEGRSEWRTENLRRSLKKHALGFFGDAKPVDEITFKEVRRLVIKLKNSGAKPKSIWHWVSNLRATLNYAARQGLLKENPINNLSSPALRKI